MFYGARTSQLIRLECKGIMIRKQQFPGDSGITRSPLAQTIKICLFVCCLFVYLRIPKSIHITSVHEMQNMVSTIVVISVHILQVMPLSSYSIRRLSHKRLAVSHESLRQPFVKLENVHLFLFSFKILCTDI